MSKKDEYEERYLRLNGKKPNARDRWKAFYQLWRMSHGKNAYADINAGDCFRVLFPNWAPIMMLDENEPTLSRVSWPKFIRRKFLDIERRRRLHGKFYEWLERDKMVARMFHEGGKEITPEEVAVIRIEVIRKIREFAKEKGIPLPKNDLEMLRWLKHNHDHS